MRRLRSTRAIAAENAIQAMRDAISLAIDSMSGLGGRSSVSFATTFRTVLYVCSTPSPLQRSLVFHCFGHDEQFCGNDMPRSSTACWACKAEVAPMEL